MSANCDDTAAGSAPGRSRWRPLLYVLLAALGFTAASWCIAALRPRHVPVTAMKLRYFQAHEDEFTTLYLGSSVIHRHVVPQVVDGELRRNGIERRSFNFGAPHMPLPEAIVLFDAVMAMEPAKLRHLVIDAHLYADSGKKNDLTARHISWHTFPETYYSIKRTLEASDADLGGQLERVRVDLKALLFNTIPAGALAETFRRSWNPTHFRRDEDDVPIEDDGYRSLEKMRSHRYRRRRRRFLERRNAYVASVNRQKRRVRTRRLTDYQNEAMLRLIDRALAAGLEPIILEGPSLIGRVQFSEAVREKATIISFHDPVAYLKLYDPDLRFDRGHLSDAGARLFSKLLARRLVEHAEGR